MTARGRYGLEVSRAVRRVIAEPPPAGLPESVAGAVLEFITGPLLDNPKRVGKRLLPPFEGLWVARRGAYRIRYEIDDGRGVVLVRDVDHRADAYRPNG